MNKKRQKMILKKKKINIPIHDYLKQIILCFALGLLGHLIYASHVTTYFAKILKMLYVCIFTTIIINYKEELKISAVNYDKNYGMNYNSNHMLFMRDQEKPPRIGTII